MKKRLSESDIEMRELVMPNDTNPRNTVFGGVVMSWIDKAAAMVASRHAGRAVVTVHIDSISFLAPIHVGEHALIRAELQYVGNSSLVVRVMVFAENPYNKESRHTTTAYLTFVALDEKGKPTKVEKPTLSSAAEKKVWSEAVKRETLHKKLRS